MPIIISALWTYPIKSCRGSAHERIRTTPRGLLGDRQWMVVEADTGRFISQRDYPALATVKARRCRNGDLLVAAPGMPNMALIQPGDDMARPLRLVTIWRDTLGVDDAGGRAADWFTQFLGRPARVVYMAPGVSRPADPAYAPNVDVTFVEGFPLLVTSEASLAALDISPDTMPRFRPNLVLAGLKPFEEDTISVIQIGYTMFELVKPCSRGAIPGIDQLTGMYEKAGNPLPALRDARTGEGGGLKGIFFGQNARATMAGSTIHIGDEAQIISRKPPHPALQTCKLQYTG